MVNQFSSCCPGEFLGGQSVLECVGVEVLGLNMRVLRHMLCNSRRSVDDWSTRHPALQVLRFGQRQQVGVPGHPVLLLRVFLHHGMGWPHVCQAPKALISV